jgi:hypothetical protein
MDQRRGMPLGCAAGDQTASEHLGVKGMRSDSHYVHFLISFTL